MATRFLVQNIPCGDPVADLAQALIGAVKSQFDSLNTGSYWNWYPVEINNNDQVALADFMACHGFPVVPQLSASGHAASGHAASGHTASGHTASGHTASGHAASGNTAFGYTALAEVHLARCAGDADAPVTSGACVHQDDEGGLTPGNYRTLIIYAKNTATGGGLAVFDGDPKGTCTIVTTRPPPDHVRAVLMDGNVWHCPVDLTGEGVRESFVFQLPALQDWHKKASGIRK